MPRYLVHRTFADGLHVPIDPAGAASCDQSRALSVIVGCLLFAAAPAAASMFASPSRSASMGDDPHAGYLAAGAGGSLSAQVREATAVYRDIDQAIAAGYEQFGGCVSGPEGGASGMAPS